MSEFPLFEASLLRAAHRRYGWRRWRPRVAVVLVAAAAAGVALLFARPAPRDPEHVAHPVWRTIRVPAYGVDVSLPSGWQIAPRSLTPHLGDPHEILTATTFAPVPSARRCTTFPTVTVGPGDALVSVQERAGAAGAAPRPQHFAPVPTSPITACIAGACLASTGTVSWLSFSDGFRNFHAVVVIDPRASARVRVEAYQILDRLRFDQQFVPWWRAAR
jgi:hypothetical protein